MRRLAPLLLIGCACASPVEPPAVEAAALADTRSTQGPFPVTARVSSSRPLHTVELVWRDVAAAQGAVRTPMAQDQPGVWRAAIPGLGAGARVAYHVEAATEDGDRGYDPPGSRSSAGCGPELCFSVLP